VRLVVGVEVVKEVWVVAGALRLVAGRAVVDGGAMNRRLVVGKRKGICGCGCGCCLCGANRNQAN
jgi:hypothetical protein